MPARKKPILSRWLKLGVFALALQLHAEDRPNIIWIISDDLSPDLGCYGEQLDAVATPHLDQLATEGVRYTHMFGTSSVCSPNRSAFNTGRYQTSIGAHHHRTLVKKPLPDGVLTIPERFQRAGYFITNGRPEHDASEPMVRKGKLDWNFSVSGEPFDGTDWSQRDPGQPFFAQVNISEAHRPWTRDMERPVDPSKVDLPPYYPDHPIVRIDWALYLEEVQRFDRKVGQILNRLVAEGLAESTIVFVFGDNGRSFPRDKGYLYDGGIRVPLIVRWPDGSRAGEVDDRMISMIDLGPTALDLAGLAIPDNLHGRSFLAGRGAGRTAVFSAKDRTGVVRDRIRSVRTRDYKYIRNYVHGVPYLPTNEYTLLVEPTVAVMLEHPLATDSPFNRNIRPVEELYALGDDPFELHNLADSPDHADVLISMRARLEEWVEISGDQGVIHEEPEAIEPYRVWLDEYLTGIAQRMGVQDRSSAVMFSYWMNKYDLN